MRGHHDKIHSVESPYKGETVTVQFKGTDELHEFVVEDYWDRVTGDSWMWAEGNPAALNYAMRVYQAHLPLDDEVLYGKIGAFGFLIHVSEVQS